MEVVWESVLDKKYKCQVLRLGAYHGCLMINDELGKNLTKKPVTMSFDAKFGPDVDDVERWQDMCTEFVDSLGEN